MIESGHIGKEKRDAHHTESEYIPDRIEDII